ncbi:MAG TPA: MFS transporter [Candidatus Eisenbacteria bacterium]|jgi:NNP family nitrate/nitrite transporter-like MFS transporter|nr:MFS transporter [Candidatus Eisenbacteria bacterium]
MASGVSSSRAQLSLGTLSFAICFAAWGLISAFAPRFRELFHLTATQTAFLVAVPVLLGALLRIATGMLADRFGGRVVFAALMIVVAAPAYVVPMVPSYQKLLMVAFFLGIAGSSFAVGVGFVSRWFPPEKQGSALGVYGLGNIGQSAAVFLGPVLAVAVGWQNIFRGMAALLILWGAIFYLLARNSPKTARPAGVGAMMRLLSREKLSWVLSLFYFLTFGGFVAFSIYLPVLLKDQFGLKPADAGFRTAGFVVLATLARPLGGWLADKIGGARVLQVVFLGIVPFALLMSWPSMLPFTVGALGCAFLLGNGNGAVFKLVPQYFPKEVGTVTGLVGAMGGLGGFFPPLVLGFFRDRLHTVWPGFALLAFVSAVLWRMNAAVFLSRQETAELTLPASFTRTTDRIRAGVTASFFTGLLVATIVVGSRNLQNFDAALVIYTFATIFATWGVVYHYRVWLDKPPTRVYWQRGWQLFLEAGIFKGTAQLLKNATTHLAAQTFLRRRSALRWWMHQMLFWGCLLAVAITFPLVFGWISFQTLSNDQETYVILVYGFPVQTFRLHTLLAEMIFHGLDISAILVLGGIGLSLWRRFRDRGAQAVQSFALDFLPIILLFAISVTGLALTASQNWLRGEFYSFLAILHAITVVAALLYLPFGKFFHIFQRPAQLGVKFYQAAGTAGEGAACKRCGERFASRMHIDDLKKVLPQLGFDYRLEGTDATWQELCPACKRKSLSLAQLRLKEEARG